MVGLFDRVGRDRIAEQFEVFDRAHPEVYLAFKRYALELYQAGRRRGSARDVLGRVRWETAVNPRYQANGEFKVNNNFAAVMARKVMEEEPGLAGFFETRERKSVAPGSGASAKPRAAGGGV
jgi:hypothetical protein